MSKKKPRLMRVDPEFFKKVRIISAEEEKTQTKITEEMVDFLDDWTKKRREKRKYEFKF